MKRNAFTLIELLIAMVIIAILLGLLLPAITGTRRTVRVAQVKTEMSTFETAIAAFHATYDMDPPSVIYLQPAGTPIGNWDVATVGALRRIWPQFDFARSGGLVTIGPIRLNGSECLVFFLGGRGERNMNGKWEMKWFSKNQRQPLARSADTGGEFFRFNTDRLVDVNGNGFPEYLDTLPGQVVPYVYLSSYGRNQYRYEVDSNGNGIADPSEDRNGNGVIDYPDANVFVDAYRNMKFPYLRAGSDLAYRDKSFQIISAGFDYKYGTGGTVIPGELIPDGRLYEGDNITNFHGGVLGR